MKHDDKPRDNHELDLEDPLGIARTPVPSDDSDRMRGMDDDDAETRRRRARAGLDGHDTSERPGTVERTPDGASGIDMGYGGEGTDVKPSR